MNTIQESHRYYLVEDDNSRSIVDGLTGDYIQTEPNFHAGREARFSAQELTLAELNAQDYSTRRQFGEPRAAFEARSGMKDDR